MTKIAASTKRTLFLGITILQVANRTQRLLADQWTARRRLPLASGPAVAPPVKRMSTDAPRMCSLSIVVPALVIAGASVGESFLEHGLSKTRKVEGWGRGGLL